MIGEASSLFFLPFGEMLLVVFTGRRGIVTNVSSDYFMLTLPMLRLLSPEVQGRKEF